MKESLTPITSSAELAEFCAELAQADFVTVDTEFMRERTYWPVLCLVQLAGPEQAACIDALADGIDLTPLYDLMANPNVQKVFHAARQDIEIFVRNAGAVPGPMFDTQVAAMVCGFGDSVAYETLAAKLANARVDKVSRFADWSQRPLSVRHIKYALSDVTHLRRVYKRLSGMLRQSGRADWLAEEMQTLTARETYEVLPDEAWKRFKRRSGKSDFLAVLKSLAAWREREAQVRDVPRARILRDDAVLDVAGHAPRDVKTLARCRGVGRSLAEGRLGAAILAAVEEGLAMPEEDRPKPEARPEVRPGTGPLAALLKVLLSLRCEEAGVAQKLVSSAADVELIASDDEADVPALKGWRRELFGNDALALKHGRLALTSNGRKISIIRLDETTEPEEVGSQRRAAGG